MTSRARRRADRRIKAQQVRLGLEGEENANLKKLEETKMAIKRICDACGAAYDASRCVKRGKRYYCPICQDKPKKIIRARRKARAEKEAAWA